MISLSNVIKAPLPKKERHLLGIKMIEDVSDALSSEHALIDDPAKLEFALKERVDQTNQQVNEMLQHARDQVQAVEEELQRNQLAFQEECEQIRKQESDRGYQDGFAKGQEEGYLDYQERITEVNRWVADAKSQYKRAIQEAEPQILELSVQIAEAIISDTLNNNKEAWLSLVKKALTEVKDQEQFKLTVSPKWYDFLNDQKNELSAIIQDAPLFIYVNQSFAENDCLIETPSGQLHASVDSQLQVLKNTLFSMLEEQTI